MKLFTLVVMIIGLLNAGNYKVDTVHSSVGFKIKHLGISNVYGTFDKFSGSFEYNEKKKKLVSLEGVIMANSINTQNSKRDKHLRSKDFFDAKKYPKIIFNLEEVKDDYAYGKLTMYGITKNVKLDFENGGSAKDPWGNIKVGLSFSGKINRTDFGLKYNKLLETGSFLIGKIIKLNIEIEGNLIK